MIRLVSILIFIANIFVLNGQETFESIKDSVVIMHAGMNEDNMNEILTNIKLFEGEDFDSLDIKIISHGPILGSIFIEMSMNGHYSYGDLYDNLLEFKESGYFEQIRVGVIAEEKIRGRKADIKNWEEDKELLIQMGAEDFLDSIKLFIEEVSSDSLLYEEALMLYKEIEFEKEKVRKEAISPLLIKNQRDFDLVKTLQESLEKKKPILFYFSGYATVNCRKFEQDCLITEEVSDAILNDFVYVSIYADDRLALPEEEQYYSELNGNLINTIGKKYSEFQQKYFQRNTQPYFVVVDAEMNILGEADYLDRDPKKFLEFLESSLKLYRQ